jgi:hypothetical protein
MTLYTEREGMITLQFMNQFVILQPGASASQPSEQLSRTQLLQSSSPTQIVRPAI